jgi:hypothetical protein
MAVGITGGHALLERCSSPRVDEPGKDRDLVLA